MEPRGTLADNVSPSSPPGQSPRRRRLSMDEDARYHRIVTSVARQPSQRMAHEAADSDDEYEPPPPFDAVVAPPPPVEGGREPLPRYSCSVSCEGFFMKKMEIENTTKRAEDRRWHPSYAVLNGTALNVYYVKKDWGWGKAKGGPGVSPDNPPWVKKGKLERAYSLQYADVGIALDYQKRRHVIRVRAEADQFLLSCVELSSFLRWLEALFSAIDVAAPIDERNFPRDQSIPRIQRIQWIRGEEPEAPPPILVNVDGEVVEGGSTAEQELSGHATLAGENVDTDDEDDGGGVGRGGSAGRTEETVTGPSREPASRFSVTSYPNDEIDYLSGKWAPAHYWGPVHDMHYAKLCYSVLLFRSPRKSNYIVDRGKKWFVDWMTGRSVRVLPPEYGELNFGPWQIVHTENRYL